MRERPESPSSAKKEQERDPKIKLELRRAYSQDQAAEIVVGGHKLTGKLRNWPEDDKPDLTIETAEGSKNIRVEDIESACWIQS